MRQEEPRKGQHLQENADLPETIDSRQPGSMGSATDHPKLWDLPHIDVATAISSKIEMTIDVDSCFFRKGSGIFRGYGTAMCESCSEESDSISTEAHRFRQEAVSSNHMGLEASVSK